MATGGEYAFSSREECLAALDRNTSQEQISCLICTSETSSGNNTNPDNHQELPERSVVLHDCHAFGERCIRKWLNEHNTCPICRKKLFPQTEEPEDVLSPWADLSEEARGAELRELMMLFGHDDRMMQRAAAEARIARLAGPRVPMRRERVRTSRHGRQNEQDRAWLDSPDGRRLQRQFPWFRGEIAASFRRFPHNEEATREGIPEHLRHYA